MVQVSPFRGLRYNDSIVGDWGAMLGPPYDIVNESQTAALQASSPLHISHIEMAAGDNIPDAAARLADWRANGVIIQDDHPSYYLHEHYFQDEIGDQVRRALFAAVELRPWGDGVMAHERTMPGPKATRTALRSIVGADISPLMAFAPDADGALSDIISRVAAQPSLHQGSDPTADSHTLRRINDHVTVAAITDAFAAQPIYMADGHHRFESALASIDHRPASRRVLMGIVCADDPGLKVGATHRLVHREVPSDAVTALQQRFRVTPADRSQIPSLLTDGAPTLGLISSNGAWLLAPSERANDQMPSDVPAAWGNLSAAVLQYAVLQPLFGIDAETLAGGQVVTYTHHVAELFSAVDSGSANAGFLLAAPTMQDVIDTANAGSFMPQKSTYFVPKLPTGLVLHSLD